MKKRYKFISVILVIIIMWLSVGVSHAAILYNDNYNCVYMSRDFEDIVESFGIPVTLIRGADDECGHLWVKVFSIEIDPVFLIPFPVHIYYAKNQREFNDWEDYLEWSIWY